VSAFRALKRQVDDSKTMRQLAATGQDRAMRDRLPRTCCGILKHRGGVKCKRKVAAIRDYFPRDDREQLEVEYVSGELANSKVLVVTYPTRCGFGNQQTRQQIWKQTKAAEATSLCCTCRGQKTRFCAGARAARARTHNDFRRFTCLGCRSSRPSRAALVGLGPLRSGAPGQ
jgi:hypothetical protein